MSLSIFAINPGRKIKNPRQKTPSDGLKFKGKIKEAIFLPNSNKITPSINDVPKPNNVFAQKIFIQ